jgi:hypothetical protein
MQHVNQMPERVLELRDLYEFAQILNEIGFNLSTQDLEREAHTYGYDLTMTILDKRGKAENSQ